MGVMGELFETTPKYPVWGGAKTYVDAGYKCNGTNADTVCRKQEDTAVVFHASEENYHDLSRYQAWQQGGYKKQFTRYRAVPLHLGDFPSFGMDICLIQ